MDRERKLVTLSMVVLFFSLIVVYSLFYQIKGEKILGVLHGISSSSSNETLVQEPIVFESSRGGVTGGERRQFYENRPQVEGDSLSDISTGIDADQVDLGNDQTASTENSLNGDGPIILSGTDLYFGAVDSIELLGLEPDYILKDYKGFYYSRFDEEPNIKSVVQRLGGNIYTITSDAELVKNELFGDKISFINLPEYKNKTVVMEVTVNGQYWLIQMSYEKYHHAKAYLKNLFF